MVKFLLNDVFGSLSDETRRDILQQLLLGEQTVSMLAKAYEMSLPAVSKHLKVLEAAGLVVKEKRGRQWFVRLSSAALREAAGHLLYYETALHNRLDSFGDYLQQKPIMARSVDTPAARDQKPQTITITKILDAGLETAWHVYTDPASITKWWQLPGAELIRVQNDVRIGGHWRFTVRGADAHEYILGGTYGTVKRPYRLEYTDGIGEPEGSHPEAQVRIDFKQLSEDKTLLTKKSVATPAVHQLNAAWYRVIGSG